jgi:hypothetical protein
VSNLSFGQNIKETSADKGFNIPYMIHQNCPEIEEQTTLGKCSLKELRNWLYRKTDFSINKFKNGSYRCIIKFQIDAKGSVSRLQIRSQDKNFQQELEKAFKKFPSTFRAVDIDGNVLNTAVGFTLTWVVSNQ